MQPTLPCLFLSHGAPTLVTDPCPTRDWLRSAAAQWPQPRAIICVSAHWCTAEPSVSGASQPQIIHDFHGFPDELYAMRYPAPGEPSLAVDVARQLKTAGMSCKVDGSRGLDHGAWVPLKLLYPHANIPVLQLSVQPQQSPEAHMTLGRALRPLRDEGVLILASGGATHNLADFRGQSWDAPTENYVQRFDRWLTERVQAGNAEAICEYLQAPEGERNHPTAEHFLPLLVAFGAAQNSAAHRPQAELIHHAFTYGILSMASFRWG